MADVFSKKKRSWIMARVHGGDTKPEMLVRRLVHGMGFRYRLHVRTLPGSPDIVLPKHKKVVFVHGCFWHGHRGCRRSQRPTSNRAFWDKKIDGNLVRDRLSRQRLKRSGWATLVVWECKTRDPERLRKRLATFLRGN
ncbi:MAG: DNA mismatch endonuclease Vsr [Nitrospirae bacterium]|nr:DNA mismatch endonuclease Vsr [Nitrospirota bacterium]